MSGAISRRAWLVGAAGLFAGCARPPSRAASSPSPALPATPPPIDPGARALSGRTCVDGAIALDATHAYFVALGGLYRVPKRGGAVERISAERASGLLVLDSDRVYFTSSDAILVVDKRGGAVRAVAAGQDAPRGLALDATDVYWATGGRSHRPFLRRAGKDGGPVVELAMLPEPLSSVVVSAQRLWVGTVEGLLSVDKRGGRPAIVAHDTASHLALDLDTLYGIEPDAGAVFRLRTADARPSRIASLPPATTSVAAFTLDAAHLYVSITSGDSAEILHRVSKSGGTFAAIASPARNPGIGLAADDVEIYLGDAALHPHDGCVGGSLLAIRKPIS